MLASAFRGEPVSTAVVLAPGRGFNTPPRSDSPSRHVRADRYTAGRTLGALTTMGRYGYCIHA